MSNPAFRHSSGAAVPPAKRLAKPLSATPSPAPLGSVPAKTTSDFAECPEVARLRQVTGEMEQAIRMGDWNRAAHISGLLAPLVSACQQAAAEAQEKRSSITQEVGSLQARLEDCTVRLNAAMTEHGQLLARLRQSQRRAPYRPSSGNTPTSSRRLDTLR